MRTSDGGERNDSNSADAIVPLALLSAGIRSAASRMHLRLAVFSGVRTLAQGRVWP